MWCQVRNLGLSLLVVGRYRRFLVIFAQAVKSQRDADMNLQWYHNVIEWISELHFTRTITVAL